MAPVLQRPEGIITTNRVAKLSRDKNTEEDGIANSEDLLNLRCMVDLTNEQAGEQSHGKETHLQIKRDHVEHERGVNGHDFFIMG